MKDTEQPTERGAKMRTTHLIAVLTGLAAIATVTTDAHAIFHPGMGRFLQRDPGAGGAGLERVGSYGPGVGERFIQREPTASNQYADGMSLYQYAECNPIGYTDPSGEVVVILAGAGQSFESMNRIKQAIDAKLTPVVAKYSAKNLFHIHFRKHAKGPLTKGYDNGLRDDYEHYKKRKKQEPCSLEQFVAVGHSSGASAIYNLLWEGAFNKVPGQRKMIQPAYLGLIDMVLFKKPAWSPDLRGKVPLFTGVQHYKTWGRPEIQGIRNFRSPWYVNHFSILHDEEVIESLSSAAAKWYEIHLMADSLFGKLKWDTSAPTKDPQSDPSW